MAVFKWEYDRYDEQWNLAEEDRVKPGGSTEEKLYNRFDPDPSSFYIAAESQEEAERRVSDPTMRGVMDNVMFSKEADRQYEVVAEQLGDINEVREIRRELYEDLTVTEQWYRNQSINGDDNTARDRATTAVFEELYHANSFATPERTQEFLTDPGERSDMFSHITAENSGGYAHPADAADAAWRNDQYLRRERTEDTQLQTGDRDGATTGNIEERSQAIATTVVSTTSLSEEIVDEYEWSR